MEVSEVLMEFYLHEDTQKPYVKVTFVFSNGETRTANTEIDANIIRFMLDSRREVATA